MQDNYTLVEELLYRLIFALQKSSNQIVIAAFGNDGAEHLMRYRRRATNRLHQGCLEHYSPGYKDAAATHVRMEWSTAH